MKRSEETTHSVIAKEEAMSTIAQNELLTKIPLALLEREIEQFAEPVSKRRVKIIVTSLFGLSVRIGEI